jgi:cobaltochelatase CobS
MKRLKTELLPLLREASTHSDFSKRRNAARNAVSTALAAWSRFGADHGWHDTDLIPQTGVDYSTSPGHLFGHWPNDAWASDYGVKPSDMSASKVASFVGSPYVGLSLVAAILMHLDGQAEGHDGALKVTKSLTEGAFASIADSTWCLESDGGKRTYGLSDQLVEDVPGTSMRGYAMLDQYLMSNFGVGLGAPPRGYKSTLVHVSSKPNPAGLGSTSSPIGTTTMENENNDTPEQAPQTDKGGTSPKVIASALQGLDPSLRGAIDAMLASAGIANTKTLAGLVSESVNGVAARTELAEKNELVEKLKSQVADLTSKAAMVGPVEVKGEADIPDGKIDFKKAYEVFEIPKAAHKLFDFDVPVGEWDAPHPHVPEINDDYVFDAEILVTLLIAIRKNQVPWLKGHTGTGKTTMIEQIYARLNIPVFRVNLDSDISRGDLVGREVLTTDSKGNTVTKFTDGIIPLAMQQPCCLLLDEIDASRPDLGFVLQRLTEGNGFMLLEDGGRTVTPHPYFRICATANTNGRGDETGLYSGTRAMGVALLNRFKPFIDVDYMTVEEEEALILDQVPGIPPAIAKQIAAYAGEHRKAFVSASVTLPNSPRDTLAMAMAYTDFGMFGGDRAMGLALKTCIMNAADADDQNVLIGLAQRVFNSAATKGLGK